jgi:hypothetical protein
MPPMLPIRHRAGELRPVGYEIIEKNQARPKSARPNLSIVRGVAEISAKVPAVSSDPSGGVAATRGHADDAVVAYVS